MGRFEKKVDRCFQDAWDEFGDEASTEFLLGITADRMGIEYGDVVDALAAIYSNPANK